ncbi:MBL fold metallo-hydrolase [Ferruginibacter paludis]|uniref:MBL fold metallo-hydrolase n=1 Tax=Ferruginibacter paludis TaxID=1310417 RepID=UPI0025B38F52|nr:MBL fold metallo-hydrolase [Ferruginibacter paludis]MDN3655419.1 MBL fold metallo-hydrolase [Ferruginibacter paludis]
MARLYFTSVLLLSFLVSSAQVNTNKDSSLNGTAIKVTLLGTGTPQPLMDRFGPSTLVQAGNTVLLFDAGRGCLQRLRQLKIEYDSLDALFLTHLHSDHIVGLSDLWLTGWLITDRKTPLPVFGPAGARQMTDYLQKAYAFDMKIRVEDDNVAIEGGQLVTTDIKEGIVYEKNGVKVIAFLVDHYPVIPAFGYRIEYAGHAVVLSGDTRYSANLIRFAKGTDLLVHEVVIAPGTLKVTDPKYHILAHHTTPEQACRVFKAVQPKLAVYDHIVRLYGHSPDEIIKLTQLNYSGPFVVGEDLMNFSVGDTVTIKRWGEK